MTISKSEATSLFKEVGIEGLPAYITRRENASQSIALQPSTTRWTIRTAGHGEDKNLPRLIDASSREALAWIAASEYDTFILQPYDELLFSVELVFAKDELYAEIVVGIWELDNAFTPATIRLSAGNDLELTVPLTPQRARVWNSVRRVREVQERLIEDWQLTATLDWLQTIKHRLRLLADRTTEPLGVKAHFSRQYGMSPQNIHTENIMLPERMDRAAPTWVPIIDRLDDTLSNASAVMLRLELARESQGDLQRLIEHLRQAGVESVYIRSGLLSHFAITLREHGFQVLAA